MAGYLRKIVTAACLVALTAGLHAKSTTAVTVVLEGAAIPGETSYLHVTLTGKHYVYAGGCSFFPGKIDLSKDGSVVNTTNPTTFNSNVVDQQAVPAAPGTGCFDSNSGQYYAVKVFGDLTEYIVPYQLPEGRASYQFTASFSGDGDANGSTSAPLNFDARYPDDSPIINYLIMD
jgi:hypothetical protein